MKLGFVITDDKSSYVAKGDSNCLLSVVKETALNKQLIKPCVPLQKGGNVGTVQKVEKSMKLTKRNKN